jgi:hypothetical protein
VNDDANYAAEVLNGSSSTLLVHVLVHVHVRSSVASILVHSFANAHFSPTMTENPRQAYQAWIEEQLEEYKAALTRDELLDLAELAVKQLFDAPDGQYPLTEILLCDAVDRLLFERLDLPDYRQWARLCRKDTGQRPLPRTPAPLRAVS